MEFLRRFFRGESPQPKHKFLSQSTREQELMERLARRSLTYLYTHRESLLAQTTASRQQSVSGGDEDLRRFLYDLGNRTMGMTGYILEVGEEQILSYVVPEKRGAIHVQSLRSAKAYWEQTLERPDNPTDVVMLGRRRLTQIAGKLEKLDPNPK